MSVLEVNDLSVEYETENGPLRAVDDLSMTIEKGDIIGVVGESGCGKTTLTKAVLGLLPQNGQVVNGEICFDGFDLTTISKKEFNSIRWEKISYIIQNAMNALDPVQRIEVQFIEVIQAHTDVSKSEAKQRTKDMLNSVGIESNRARDYPHELSGGQRQRVVIALALALQPPLVIADEPTTGLDVVIQSEILNLVKNLQQELGNTMIIITHDTSVISEIADKVLVMYGGQIVEIGKTHDVFKESAHPYTMGLTNSFPSLETEINRLISIPGAPPDLVDVPNGCRFAERCPFETEKCQTDPPLATVANGHLARCHYTERAPEFREESKNHETWSMLEDNNGDI